MNAISDPGENNPALLDRAGRQGNSRLAKLAHLSLSNVKSSIGKLLWRLRNRPARFARIEWKTPLFTLLLLIVMAVVLLDAPLGAFRGRWPAYMWIPAEYITLLGLSGLFIIPAAIVLAAANLTDWSAQSRRGLLILYNRTTLALFVVTATGLSGLISVVLKYAIGRARPEYYHELGMMAFKPLAFHAYFASFPSGHSTTVGSVAALLILFFPQSRFYVIPLAVCIAATRIVVGAHYPSDVVAGFAFGFAATLFTAIVFARLGYIFEQVPSGMPTVKKSARILW